MKAPRPLQRVLGEQGGQLLEDLFDHGVARVVNQLGIANSPVQVLHLVREDHPLNVAHPDLNLERVAFDLCGGPNGRASAPRVRRT